MSENTLIIGCGDIGKRVLKQIQPNSPNIYAASHRKSSQNQLMNYGISVIPANLNNPEDLEQLPTPNAHIFYFAPPVATGITDTRMVNFIQSLNKKIPPKRIIYISTTGIYGNCHGEWITETTTLKPGADRSKRRLHAESLIQEFCSNNTCEFVILRVPGIYCLEKLPLARLKSGMKILHPDIAPASNRIHADDLANCCVKAMFDGPANEIFNVADGHPSSMSDYFIQVAKIFHLPEPELLTWEQAEKELSPAMLSYLHESKKINIDKLLNVLNVKLEFPTLIEGLQNCLELQNKNDS